jgi:hypothetical protein
MAYASQAGRARTNPSNPQAHAICDRCGFRYNHVDLRWQYDWRGTSLANTRVLVCPPCYDEAQQQLRAIVLPADPVPITNPRVQEFVTPIPDYRMTSGPNAVYPFTGIPMAMGALRVTSDDDEATADFRVTQQVGPTASTLNEQPGLDQGAAMYSTRLAVASITANGGTTLTVVTSEPHGMVTGNYVSVEGTSLTGTNGFFTVTVVDATTFTYMVTAPVMVGTAVLMPTTLITATNVGTPYDMTIPQAGYL